MKLIEKTRKLKRLGTLLPGTLSAVIPIGHCPACLPLYAGALSSLGLGFMFQPRYLLWIMVIFLLPALFTLAWKASDRRGYMPLWGGLIGASMILAGKFQFQSNLIMAAGMIILIAASIWNVLPAHQKDPTCPHCKNTNKPLQ